LLRGCNNSLAKGPSVAKVKRLKTLLFIAVMGNGCRTLDSMKVNGRYLVVSAVHYAKKYKAFTEEQEEIRVADICAYWGTAITRYIRWLADSNNNCKFFG